VILLGTWCGIGMVLGFIVGREAYRDKETFWIITGVSLLVWIGWIPLVPWAIIDMKVKELKKNQKNKRELLSKSIRIRRRFKKWLIKKWKCISK